MNSSGFESDCISFCLFLHYVVSLCITFSLIACGNGFCFAKLIEKRTCNEYFYKNIAILMREMSILEFIAVFWVIESFDIWKSMQFMVI